MKEALYWWYNTLTESGRNQFPKPKDDDDILNYYTNPSEYIYLEYGI